jgi:hypothetical protein
MTTIMTRPNASAASNSSSNNSKDDEIWGSSPRCPGDDDNGPKRHVWAIGMCFYKSFIFCILTNDFYCI